MPLSKSMTVDEAMPGDGINGAPALSGADVSIATSPSATLNPDADMHTTIRYGLIIYGIALMIGGVFCLVLPQLAGIAVEIVIGAFFALTGIITLATGLMVPLPHRHLMMMGIGLAELAIGELILAHPYVGLSTITVCIGIAFIFQGIARFFLIRHLGDINQHFFWFLGALAALVLGFSILTNLLPSSGWILGTLCGVSFLFHGLTVTHTTLQYPQATADV